MAALPALSAARAPVGQLDAASMRLLTRYAGNGALLRLLRRGDAAAEGLPLPDGAPETERFYEGSASLPQETAAAENLGALPLLTGGAAWEG